MENEVIFKVSRNIMFDPSLLLDAEKFEEVFEFLERKNDFRCFIPDSFLKLDRLDENHLYEISKFFEAENADLRHIHLKLNSRKNLFVNFKVKEEHYEKYDEFYKNLREYGGNEKLTKILFEEWVFLQEYSWLTSKSKNVFKKFEECGAWVLEGSKTAFEYTVKKTLKKDQDSVITTANKLRTLGKWFGVGLNSAASLIEPLAAVGITATIGFMMIIDPDD